MQLRIKNNVGNYHVARALLDTGANVSVIRKQLVSELCLSEYKSNIEILGVGNTRVNNSNTYVNIEIRPLNIDLPIIRTKAIVMKELTSCMPSQSVDMTTLLNTYKNSLNLADPLFNKPRRIDLILGTEILNMIYDGTKFSLNKDLAAYGTIFGEVLIGPVYGNDSSTSRLNTTQCTYFNINSLIKAIQRFWESEEMPREPIKNPLYEECEQLFIGTTTRDSIGKYIVRLPLLKNRKQLGNSYNQALIRFSSLERKLKRNIDFANKYREFMNEYETLNHMSPFDGEFSKEHYFIPHHGIFKKDNSAKIRVVFDASMRTTSGLSLNDVLYTGAPLQNDITKILLNFRKHKYVFTTDIKMAFRMTWIHPDDRRYQLILWRKSESDPITVYQLNTNTYGLRSSPYICIRALHQLTSDYAKEYPRVTSIVKNDIFVDDILTGSDSISNTILIRDQLIELLSKGGYELRKWSSNCKEIIADLPQEHCEIPVQFDERDNQSLIKVLGIQWRSSSDSFTYKVNVPSVQPNQVTKRNILSTIARLYDPNGYVNPVILRFKLLLQQLFKNGLLWDETIASHLIEQYFELVNDLNYIESISIPRHIILPNTITFSIHGFGDASENAYSACVYIKSVDKVGNSLVRLAIAKSKVAPIKTKQTIPKLELSAAHLVTKLINHVYSTYTSLNFSQVYGWSDSGITLAWLKTSPHLLQTFEGNRVQDIIKSPCKINWRYVPSALNPADCASRGTSAQLLLNNKLWWECPWLLKSIEYWPPNDYNNVTGLPGLRKLVNTTQTSSNSIENIIINKFSSYNKIVNTYSWILRYINNLRNKLNRNLNVVLSLNEINCATTHLIKYIQSESFNEELNLLRNNKPIVNSINKLHIFLDSENIIRVGGRLINSPLKYESRHQILLPKDHRFVSLLIEHYHKMYCHVGPNGLIALLRNKYWIPSIRRQVCKVIHKCITCHRFNPRINQPPMADLPTDRVSSIRPFASTATDFAGPYLVKASLLRNSRSVKAYMCVFVCTATKAVHLELVSSLTVEAFIAAFTRFASRRGVPSIIRSDNGTNFTGANKELTNLYDFMTSHYKELSTELRNQSIKWLFNPPSAPNFGGLFEAAVKSAKNLIKRVIGEQILTFEELYTVFTKVEAILNSRPLVPISNDPNDLDILTPGHFLIGQGLIALPEYPFNEIKASRLSRFQLIQKISQSMWNRFYHEYLSTLQTRNKWYKQSENLKIGDLVLICDDNLPPLQWLRARVTEVHPGKDGVVRSVKLRTSQGTLVRPSSKLSKLPID